MGARGPGAKPVRLRVLEGTLPDGAAEVLEPKGVAQCPDFLAEIERSEWGRLTKAFPPGYFTSADQSLLTAYCLTYGLMQRTYLEHQASGYLLVEGETDSRPSRQDPLVATMIKAGATLATMAGKLGIGPSTRGMSFGQINGKEGASTSSRRLWARKA